MITSTGRLSNKCLGAIPQPNVVADRLGVLGLPVVIDYGFAPESLTFIEFLREAGVKLMWFDGNRQGAIASFAAREKNSPGPMAALSTQLAKIDAQWPALQAVFNGRMIHTVSDGPSHLAHDEVWQIIQELCACNDFVTTTTVVTTHTVIC